MEIYRRIWKYIAQYGNYSNIGNKIIYMIRMWNIWKYIETYEHIQNSIETNRTILKHMEHYGKYRKSQNI